MTVSDEARRMLAAELGEPHLATRVLEAAADTGVFITPKEALRAIEAALSQRPSPHDEGVIAEVKEDAETLERRASEIAEGWAKDRGDAPYTGIARSVARYMLGLPSLIEGGGK